ncbi:hypothetical protein PUN4_1120038 [Paraburkholderia unamae]|nr:hypothetical protein PUN4_1120038 [Paraburkholderia unamae]
MKPGNLLGWAAIIRVRNALMSTPANGYVRFVDTIWIGPFR